MGGVTEQGDTQRAVCFHDFLFKSVQILTCYGFFSASPSSGPDNVGAHALKSTLTCERRREAEGGGNGKDYGRGSGRVRGARGYWAQTHRNRYAISALTFALIFFFCSIFLFLKLLLLVPSFRQGRQAKVFL